jgi:nitrite reductase (NADH) large subunit
MRRLDLVVVGNGMVSHRFCEKMVEYDPNGRYRLTVVGEEPRPAYDRVHLTDYLSQRSADALLLGTPGWYQERGVRLLSGTRVTQVDRSSGTVALDGSGGTLPYDVLVLATGSAPFVPKVPGVDQTGIFVYRTIEDLDGIILRTGRAKRAVVIGGGLLGLEAARAVHDAGLETHVLEVAPRLMPRQLDVTASDFLERSVRELGVAVHVDKQIVRFLGEGDVQGVELVDGSVIAADLVVISAGIRPRDELARSSGIDVGSRGGIVVDDCLRTSDERVFAIGEVALHRGLLYGLVAPGYEMAEVVARNLTGGDVTFVGSDLSAKLKLLGTDVATFGDPFQDPSKSRVVRFEDQIRGTYQKFVFHRESRELLGGILVGDAKRYSTLLHLTRSKKALSENLEELGLAGSAEPPGKLTDDVQLCSCNNVLVGTIRKCIRDDELSTVAQVKACTKAGTGCGGCLPLVTDLLQAELAAAGRAAKPRLCEHFAFTRQELFQIASSKGIKTFAQLLAEHGSGLGCEICKPAVASIMASLHNEPILDRRHRTLQDSNDRYLANIQRNGTYSIVPRVPGGEITPDQLIVLGRVAKRYGLYTKITGGQRIDLFGARVEQLPLIWEELITAGFESGHAYGKAMRTVKSCVGSTWCRYGVQDSTAFAIRIENRYKGIRAPHKFKSAVSGCVRECAEAQSKDFGLIATERGWNIYVCGNGGATPRHADLLASDVESETAIRYLDRFLVFYIRTADRLTRTSVWLEKMEGGIEHLRDVVVHDSLGIAADLERQMQHLVDTYECEWKGALLDPEKRATFQPFANDVSGDSGIRLVAERGQLFPDGRARRDPLADQKVRRLPVLRREWVRLASVRDVPADGGIAARHGGTQIAIFHFASTGTWYATQNLCPHQKQMVLARGIVGDHAGAPKVACPLHKKTFDVSSGRCLSGEDLSIETFPVRILGDDVLVELPPAEELAAAACHDEQAAHHAAAQLEGAAAGAAAHA